MTSDGVQRPDIGSYKIIRLLGTGGMSAVYEVENKRLGSRHALKLFTYEKDDAEVRERFLTEGRLLAHLNHPRIVKVTDIGTETESGRPFFIMELVLDAKGETHSLADIQPGAFGEEEIGRLYDDLREGLAYIHANGVIHRDLKLQNVLIGPDGRAVLTDFGISKVFDPKGDGKVVVDAANTIVKMKDGRSLVMGSVGYMAPELEMGVAASPQSDYYALGVIVFRLLTGSWCDARTDVVSVLETYAPAWSRIVPKLLHANPHGRECLSYAEERQLDHERDEQAWESRWLRAKAATHGIRRLVFVLSVLLGLSWLGGIWHYSATFRVRRQAALPTFADVVKLPETSLAGNSWEIERAHNSLTDAWSLTHQLFDDLRRGDITFAKAQESLSALASKSEIELLKVMGPGSGVTMRGDLKILSQILKDAAVEMSRHPLSGAGK